MDKGQMKIVKVGEVPSMPRTTPPMTGMTRKAPPQRRDKQPKHGILKHGKTARKTPRFEPVRDPAKPPPTRKGKLRILTPKGEKTRRAAIASEAKKIPLSKLKEILRKHNLPVSSKREDIIRKIYEDAQEAGMLSSA